MSYRPLAHFFLGSLERVTVRPLSKMVVPADVVDAAREGKFAVWTVHKSKISSKFHKFEP